MGKTINQYLKNPLKTAILLVIKLYRFTVSPFLGCRCRFYPSCSLYAEHAIKEYGILKGIYFSIKRLLRCHPLNSGGFDSVPENKIKSRH